MTHEITEQQKQDLFKHAKQGRENAYAPYSKFRVGAAILTEDNEIFSGCNVENISYGLTSCAERNAIFSAISQGGALRLKAVVVVTDKNTSSSPCGACRQVINEFGPEALITYPGSDDFITKTAQELLPDAFNEF